MQQTLDIVLDQTRADIKRNFPEFNINSICFIGEGLDSRALLVNNQYVFRFPKFPDVAEQLEVEIKFLPQLRGKLSLDIPNFEYIGRQANNLPFVGYRIIQGEFLTSEQMRSLDPEARRQVCMQLAGFLQSVHSFPLEIAENLGIETQDIKEDCENDYATIRIKVFPLLDDISKQYVERLYQEFFVNPLHFEYERKLCHSDLSSDHILFNPEKSEVSGVIDFGDVNITDPDFDLMYLYQDYGEDFVKELLAYYPHDNHSLLFSKLEFFRRQNTLWDILIGIDRQDNELIAYALAKLVNDISHNP